MQRREMIAQAFRTIMIQSKSRRRLPEELNSKMDAPKKKLPTAWRGVNYCQAAINAEVVYRSGIYR